MLLLFFIAGCNVGTKAPATDADSKDTIQDELARLKLQAESGERSAEVYNQLANAYLEREKLNEALHAINVALELEPANEVFFFTLAEIYLQMGDASRALTTLIKASELNPNNADVFVQLGRLQIITRDYPRAMENLRKALAINNHNSKAYFWRGYYYLEHNDTSRAINNFQMAVASDQNFFEGYLQLGQILLYKNDKLALDYLVNALNLAPPEPETIYSIGYFLQENGKIAEALNAYQKILNIDSTYFKAWYNIGYIHLVELNEREKAIDCFDKALTCNPGYVDALYNRGLAHELIGDLTKARSDYKAALHLEANYELSIKGLNRLDKLERK